MKKTLFFLISTLSLSSIFAQFNELKEKNWVNSKIILGGKEIIVPTNNTNDDYKTSLIINEYGNVNKLNTGLCGHTLSLDITKFSDSSFEGNFTGETLMQCNPNSSFSKYESDYFKVWTSVLSQDLGPFTYQISNDINNSQALIVKNKNGDEAHFNYSKLKTQDLNNLKTTIFPNPVNEELNINFNTISKREITLSSIDGKLIKKQIIKSNYNQINTSNLSKGIYILQISENGKVIKSEKIIKQ